MIQKDFTYSICWNLLQIICGSVLSAIALKGIALPHRFIPGGLFGASSLIFYTTDLFNIAGWYLLFNLPMFVIAWRGISRRFLWYSLTAMLVFTLAYSVVDLDLHIKNQLYAAVACGLLSGLGVGIVLRSLGSNGGLDVVAVWLFQKYNIGIGKFYFLFNTLLYLTSLIYLDIDLVIASIIMMFCTSAVMEQTLSLFNQRKVVFILSDHVEEIAEEVKAKLKIGGTMLSGNGVYSKVAKSVLMTVINNIQLKRLEEVVFTIDENALFIVENTFSVLGKSFSKRKIY
ncbi:MAG: YitT family protein [Proteobacteria bacterium]|nr:YitT family protein [Pseudomonadota bacterium]MBU1716137.1 YitT family protein [Pseudomonadota bacterium]